MKLQAVLGTAGAVSLCGVAVVVIANGYTLLATRSWVYSDPDDLPDRRVAVVPGVSEWTAAGTRNPHFDIRMEAAVAVVDAGKTTTLVLSGGPSEVTEMRAHLIEKSIDPQFLVDDQLGVTTEATVANARPHGRILIVGERFHVPRALLLARSYGLDAVAFGVASEKSHFQVLRECISERLLPAREREWLARSKAVVTIAFRKGFGWPENS